MGLLQATAVAALTAVTAILPIGWSGQRLLVSDLTGWQPLNSQETLAVSIGTFLSVAAYFWRDVIALAVGLGQIVRGRWQGQARFLLYVLAGAAPVAILGVAMSALHLAPRASATAIGWTSIAFGLLLYVGDRIGVTVRRLSHMTWGAALLIGTAEVLALFPGVGRSGLDVSLARIVGFERTEAARLSLLLSMPVLAGAIALAAFDAAATGGVWISLEASVAGLTAFVSGLAAIAAMMGWLKHRTFAPFGLYSVGGGAALLAYIYFG